MQLKKITLKGFKSFPDKTVLEFDKGLTAIVGPNGSGKSNIIEAIRWVMGEQSAKSLRGNRMEDLIFSGTDQRKAINIAEVELLLDNSQGYLDIDYTEVSITRRLSRTKGSTYLINQKECRLKDIVDLFMDSGLGKESFSVISQGEVEAVFNSKPEDRRGIFEEAAGVFKYKMRKEEAESKLDQTDDNLDRVQDILYELEAQLDPLEKQAAIAQSYLDHREKLKDLDIAVSVHQINGLSQTLTKDKEKQNQLIAEMKVIEKDMTDLEAQRVKNQNNLEKAREKAERGHNELLEIVRKKEAVESSLKLFDEKSRHRTAFIEEKENNIQTLTARIQKQEAELSQLNDNHQGLTDDLKHVDQEIADLNKRRAYLARDKNVQMEELRSDYIDYLQNQTSFKNESAYLKQELSRTELEKSRLQEHVNQLRREIKSYENSLAEKERAEKEANQELTDLLNDYQSEMQLFEQTKKKTEKLTTQLNHLQNELEGAKAKRSSLKEMQENYSGYYAGVRAVMKAQNQLDGIVGTVAELINIPEQYLLAINTLLANSGQFVVVENEKNGRDAINYLKREQKGRATFLPLTTIRSREIPAYQIEKIQSHPGYLGIASELVDNDTQMQEIIGNLLGQTIVAETLKAANEIARIIQFRSRIVSLEGDLINAGGSMTGGGQQNKLRPIFSQKAQLNQLEDAIQSKESEQADLKIKQRQAAEISQSLAEKVEEIRLAGENKRLVQQQINNERTSLAETFSRLKRELEASSFELKEKDQAQKDYQTELKVKEEVLEEINKKVKEANENMQLLTSEQEDITSARAALLEEIEERQEKRQGLREKIASEKVQIENYQRQIDEYQKEIQTLKNEIKNFHQNADSTSKEDLIQNLDEYRTQEKDIQANQTQIRTDIQKNHQEEEKIGQAIEQLNGRLKFMNEEKSKTDIRLSKNDVRLDYLLDYLVEEYQVSFEEARLFGRLEIDVADAKKEVKLLKKDIEELGPVNLNAIEEFKAVSERYQFLTAQQNDLIEAKETLFDTMSEMDSIVAKRFKETFNQVKKEFSQVFPKMFGGGHAELILSDPDNLLETGIEIVAQPPGKKLSRLSLLSGGERALTAISLLFAIIQVNPIPFVILDEAEAALDDANVLRFGQYLQNFEEETQFIVITHRKGTMEHSDQLYGITMQEKGVSKVVGVSLQEAEAIDGVS